MGSAGSTADIFFRSVEVLNTYLHVSRWTPDQVGRQVSCFLNIRGRLKCGCAQTVFGISKVRAQLFIPVMSQTDHPTEHGKQAGPIHCRRCCIGVDRGSCQFPHQRQFVSKPWLYQSAIAHR